MNRSTQVSDKMRICKYWSPPWQELRTTAQAFVTAPMSYGLPRVLSHYSPYRVRSVKCHTPQRRYCQSSAIPLLAVVAPKSKDPPPLAIAHWPLYTFAPKLSSQATATQVLPQLSPGARVMSRIPPHPPKTGPETLMNREPRVEDLMLWEVFLAS